jgi:hypothetical protein
MVNPASLFSYLYERANAYCRTLERLIKLAPPPQKSYPLATTLSQTILVTHYFQPASNESQRDGDESEDDEKDNGVHIYGYRGEGQNNDEESQNEDEDGGAARTAEVSQDQRSEASAGMHRTSSADDDDNTAKSSMQDDGAKDWPPEYRRFVESSVVQENLALEIASGGGFAQRPKEIQKGNVRIVVPGSLRERGEFCLVDMSLMEQAVKKNLAAASTSAASAKKKSTFAWRVRSVEFHNMERLP